MYVYIYIYILIDTYTCSRKGYALCMRCATDTRTNVYRHVNTYKSMHAPIPTHLHTHQPTIHRHTCAYPYTTTHTHIPKHILPHIPKHILPRIPNHILLHIPQHIQLHLRLHVPGHIPHRPIHTDTNI